MLAELANVMYEHGIQLKESKCKWFANAAAWESHGSGTFFMRADIDASFGSKVGISSHISHFGVRFTLALTLEVLGVCSLCRVRSSSGSFRISQAWIADPVCG